MLLRLEPYDLYQFQYYIILREYVRFASTRREKDTHTVIHTHNFVVDRLTIAYVSGPLYDARIFTIRHRRHDKNDSQQDRFYFYFFRYSLPHFVRSYFLHVPVSCFRDSQFREIKHTFVTFGVVVVIVHLLLLLLDY